MVSPQTLAFDTNTIRSPSFIPFLIANRTRFRIHVPAIVYAELDYFYFLHSNSLTLFEQEMQAYSGRYMPLTVDHVRRAIQLAHIHRKDLPFRDHNREYLIAGQCQAVIKIFVTYNVKHFQLLQLASTEVFDPDTFFLTYSR